MMGRFNLFITGRKIFIFTVGFDMYYINEITSAFKKMSYYIKMWYTVMLNEVFQELAELGRDYATWNAQSETHERIDDLEESPAAGPDGFTSGSLKDELNTQKLMSYSRQYYILQFITKAETPLQMGHCRTA